MARRGHARYSAAALTRIGVQPSRLTIRDAIFEAVAAVSRSPTRTVLTSLGTVLGCAAVVATIGLAGTARGAVSGTFDVLRATEVTFTDTGATQGGGQVMNENTEKDVERLNGVVSAGLIWDASSQGTTAVRRTAQPDPTGAQSVQLGVVAATPGALQTMGAVLETGRTYDEGMERRDDSVVLLGIAAANQLGIASVDRSPVIYVGNTQLSVIGIVSDTVMNTEALLSLIVPPGVAIALTGNSTGRTIIVRTDPGAAQLIGQQGPYAIYPLGPSRIQAEAPPDPTMLRNQVQSSVTSLFLVLAVVAMVIGIVAIANTTLLSVMQRRSEIGLRRSVGAAPKHIAMLIATESAVIGTIGGTIGASLGVLIVAAVAASRGWAPVLDLRLPILAPLAGALAGLLAGAYPAWRASEVSPITALQR